MRRSWVLELDTDAVVIVPPLIQKTCGGRWVFCLQNTVQSSASFLNLSGGGEEGGGVGALQLIVLFASFPPLQTADILKLVTDEVVAGFWS